MFVENLSDEMKIKIATATLKHANEIGHSTNADDAPELMALWRNWKMSAVRKTLIVDGEVAAIWGVVSDVLGSTGWVWLLTGPKVSQMSAVAVSRIYRNEVRELLESYDVIENLVDCRYSAVIRLLKIAGFSFDDPMPIGKFKSSFMRFYKAA